MNQSETTQHWNRLLNRPITSKDDGETTSLLQYNLTSLGNKVRRPCANVLVCSKSILVICMWNFAVVLCNTLFLSPVMYLQLISPIVSAAFTAGLAIMYLFSPLAGFLADVKFSRFKVLKCSAFLMLAATVLLLIIVFLVFYVTDLNLLVLIVSLCIVLVWYSIGRMTFVTTILQFGTDQLRDAPSQDSSVFLHWYFWVDSIAIAISLSTDIPGHRFQIDLLKQRFFIDRLRFILVVTVLCVSIFSSVITLGLLYSKKTWFLTEPVRINPYKLVYKVIRFACLNKKPIYRSAFTYCEDELPSRLDLGKCKYGGPFTTEQVEDVKAFLGILKVLFALGPAFFMDIAATASVVSHDTHHNFSYNTGMFLSTQFLKNGLLSPVLVVISVPVYLCLMRPYLMRYVPNMLKRMGLAMALLCFAFVCFIVFDVIAYNPEEVGRHYSCIKNMTYSWNIAHIDLSRSYLFVVQHSLSALYHMLLYIAAWEFICSQSPQSMKGLLFGLLYAIRGLFLCLATILAVPFWLYWKSHLLSCRLGYLLMNIVIGIVSLLIYALIARRYKYRKRDDICNEYQYAEDYYSKHLSD